MSDAPDRGPRVRPPFASDEIQARLDKRRAPYDVICIECQHVYRHPPSNEPVTFGLFACPQCGSGPYGQTVTIGGDDPSPDEDIATLLGELTDLRGERDSEHLHFLNAEVRLQEAEAELAALRGARAALQQQLAAKEKRLCEMLEILGGDADDLGPQLARDRMRERDEARVACINTERALRVLCDTVAEECSKAHGDGQEHAIADVNAGRLDDLIRQRLDVAADATRFLAAQLADEMELHNETKAALARLRSRGQALVQQWREQADAIDGNAPGIAPMGTYALRLAQVQTLWACADALTAALQPIAEPHE